MTKPIWYTARATYDPDHKMEFGWEEYKEWSKLVHLSELVSLDGMLNGLVFEPDFDSGEEWEYIVTEGVYSTQFFNSMDYILEKTKSIKYFNLLAVIKEPDESNEERTNQLIDFEFIGYDLIEREGDISALTNCGGFDESFLPSDLNEFGLVSDFEKVKKIQEHLRINNPEEHHADCFLYEVWRHKVVGRKK